MSELSDEEEGTKMKEAAPPLTRKEFNAQFAKDLTEAQELFQVIKDEAEEAEQWILRWYQVRWHFI